MGDLLGLVDDDGAEARTQQAEEALAYLQGIILLDAQHTLANTLAGWVYGVLWGAALL